MKVYLVYKGADVRYVFRKSSDARRMVLDLDPNFDFDDDQSADEELVDGRWDDPNSEWSVEVWKVRK